MVPHDGVHEGYQALREVWRALWRHLGNLMIKVLV